MHITGKEHMVLLASRKTDYGDALIDPVWSFSVLAKLPNFGPKEFGGVVSSLVKKGLVAIYKYENGNNDKVFALTAEGKEVAKDLV